MAGTPSKLTTRNLVRVLDALIPTPRWATAMATIRASERTAFVWRDQCRKAMKANDTSSIFWLEYRGTYDWWLNFCGSNRTANLIVHEATVRDQSLNGIQTVVRGPDQKILYQEREEYIGRSDAYVRDAEGLGDWEDDVSWYRLKRDPATGHPLPQLKTEQLPAPLRLAVLRQDKRYIEQQQIDVRHSGEIVTAKPFQRLPGEERPDVERLRQLAAMKPEERRLKIGATDRPLDAKGHVMLANKGAPQTEIEAPRHIPLGAAAAPARPSYARPVQSLDTGERLGRGEPPPGGMKMS